MEEYKDIQDKVKDIIFNDINCPIPNAKRCNYIMGRCLAEGTRCTKEKAPGSYFCRGCSAKVTHKHQINQSYVCDDETNVVLG